MNSAPVTFFVTGAISRKMRRRLRATSAPFAFFLVPPPARSRAQFARVASTPLGLTRGAMPSIARVTSAKISWVALKRVSAEGIVRLVGLLACVAAKVAATILGHFDVLLGELAR